ncbi:hypothetical protein G6W55_03090 [Streptomyces sp. CAI-85]|nr:hypothetical protein [Streptomyces sp. CAI-85]
MDTAETAPAAGKPARKFRPGWVAAVAGFVVLACAVAAGVGHTVVTVRDADRDPGKPTWKFPATAKDEKGEKGEKSGPGLSALLVPYGTDGYERGPDLEELGADVEFDGAEATALRKESLDGLPSRTKRELEKVIDKQRIQGMAMRSYRWREPGYFDADGMTVDVTLLRLESRTAVRRMASSYNEFLDTTDIFRKGPKIDGHKDARCYLTPKGKAGDLAGAFCTAYVGDILVSAIMAGPDPVDKAQVSKFFAAQLDRIDNPGQAV